MSLSCYVHELELIKQTSVSSSQPQKYCTNLQSLHRQVVLLPSLGPICMTKGHSFIQKRTQQHTVKPSYHQNGPFVYFDYHIFCACMDYFRYTFHLLFKVSFQNIPKILTYSTFQQIFICLVLRALKYLF